MARHFKNKYQRRDASTSTERREIVKRTSTYSVSTAESPTATNSAPVDQDGTDFSYFTQVEVGSGKTPMYLLIDTGSANTWVMAKDCVSAACKIHNTFDPSTSTSYIGTQDTFYYGYGSGNITGSFGTDSLSLAGLNVTAKFGLANITSSDFLNFPIDGIMGFGRAGEESLGFMDLLAKQNKLTKNMFCLNLNRHEENGTNDGEISFGAPDPTKYVGEIAYNNLSSTDGSWTIGVAGVSIDSEVTGITWTEKTAVIDTGSTYLYVPPSDAAHIHSAIPGAVQASGSSVWTVPCNTTSNLTLTFNSGSYSIPAEDWISSMGSDNCASMVIPQSVFGDDNKWLLGDLLLKNLYSVFDIDNNRIGMFQASYNLKLTNSSNRICTKRRWHSVENNSISRHNK